MASVPSFLTGAGNWRACHARGNQIQDLLDSLGCNPIEGMARIAMDENYPP